MKRSKKTMEKQLEPIPQAPVALAKQSQVNAMIDQKTKETTDVKQAIDLLSTKTALEKQGTVERLVDEKTKELTADAEAKKIAAETARIREEVEKVRQQGEKEIAEILTVKNRLASEVEKLNEQINKEQKYFEANEEILRVVRIKKRLSMNAMKLWVWPASLIYFTFQLLLLPLTLIGFFTEAFIDIIGGISGAFNKSGLKLILTIITVIVIGVLIIGSYWLLFKTLGVQNYL